MGMTPQETLNWCEQFTNNLVKANVDVKKRTLGLQAMQIIRSALKKQIPKKPIKKNPICYARTKDGHEHFTFDYYCPHCNEKIKTTEHHCECGQTLDWSESE